MRAPELQRLLLDRYTEFTSYMRRLPEAQANLAAPGKWSAAQQAEHLVKSVKPVNLAFSLPGFVLSIAFGRANRPSRTYDELVARYKAKLASGGKSSKPFVPGIPASPREVYDRLDATVNALSRKVGAESEPQLDKYILPHPLLGKLTLREMVYFTAYHATHHLESIKATHPIT
jgi:hypothetical protein